MRHKPFNLLASVMPPVAVEDSLITPELPVLTEKVEVPEIGLEPDPTLVPLPTLASHETMSEVPIMYSIEPSPSSFLDIASELLEEKERLSFLNQPAGTTEADIPLVAVKFDAGKTDWSLLPVLATEEIIKVLEFGAAKYDKNNWAKGNGFKWTRPFNAMLRHLFAWMRGEDNDPESGLSHIAHVGCNVLFLLTFILNKDRYNQDDRNV